MWNFKDQKFLNDAWLSKNILHVRIVTKQTDLSGIILKFIPYMLQYYMWDNIYNFLA